ncbi:MAG: glycosyltransferase, partial [Chloroflexota bacterium]
MRILYFTRDYTPHDHRFLTALSDTAHEVFFLPLERRGHRQEDRMLPQGIKRIKWAGGERPVRLKDGLRLLLGLRKVIREVNPDVLHAGPVQTVGFLAALSGFRPLVTMSWGSDMLIDADKNKRYQRVTKYTLKRTDMFVGDCEAVKNKGMEFGVPAEKIITFPWGVDLTHFSPGKDTGGLRERAGWQD